jgi:hypothetical protein
MGGFFFWPKAHKTRTSNHATGEIQDFRAALITTDEDRIPLPPVRREAAPIQRAPSERREEP